MDKYLEIIGLISQILGALGIIISIATFIILTNEYSLGFGLLGLFISLVFSLIVFSIKPIILGLARIEHNTRKLVTAASAEGFDSSDLSEAYVPSYEKHKSRKDSFFSNKKFWLIIVDVIALIVIAYIFFGM